MSSRITRTLFDLGAAPYDLLTGQSIWRVDCASLVAKFPLKPGLTVLDLGTGPGVSAISIAQAREDAKVIAIDFAPRMLNRARRSAKRQIPGTDIPFILADGEKLPFPGESFDVVTAHSFLYLVEDRETVLSEVARVLAPGGRAVFVEPNANVGEFLPIPLLRSRRFGLSMIGWRVMSRIKGRFTEQSLGQIFEQMGFSTVSIEKTLYGLGLIIVAEKRLDVSR